jgi:hypothetical protein
MAFYDNMRSVAQTMLTKYGKEITVRHTESTEYDPILDKDVPVIADYVGVGAFFDFKKEETLDGVVPQSGDQKLLTLLDGDYLPQCGDTVLGVKNYRIEAVMPISPDETVNVLVKCLVRPKNG